MRGANISKVRRAIPSPETSPHAWSKHKRLVHLLDLTRNISTCVEQTTSRIRTRAAGQKHLHMRGANHREAVAKCYELETSPHAWSKQHEKTPSETKGGNISTCVEQTTTAKALPTWKEKHLHMRGANLVIFRLLRPVAETSPHAWSKLHLLQASGDGQGNISTCVEQTSRGRVQGL